MTLTRFRFETDGVVIEGEGVVTTLGTLPADSASVVVAFLARQDPALLEEEMLARLDMGSSLTQVILEVLAERAAANA